MKKQTISIQVEIPGSVTELMNFMPIGIRKKYMTEITNALLKKNEDKVKLGINNLLKEAFDHSLSTEDKEIIEDMTQKVIKDLNIVVNIDKNNQKKQYMKKERLERKVANESSSSESSEGDISTKVKSGNVHVGNMSTKDEQNGIISNDENIEISDHDNKEFDYDQDLYDDKIKGVND